MVLMSDASTAVLDIFTRLSAIPRCSGHEEAVTKWLRSWAEEHGFEAVSDERRNVLIRVPGRNAAAAAPTVVLQGHTDMVCEKTPESPHDFATDGIELQTHDGWLTANGTTLGADNGIGVAIALAMAADASLKSPPLELLFTTEEETGLTGAQSLSADWLTGDYLLNLDSEEEGVFTIGCAGGQDSDVALAVTTEAAPRGEALELAVGGLEGGHSGIDIVHGRANANVLLARMLRVLVGESGCRLVSITGGNARNAIPRDAGARVVVPADRRDTVTKLVAEFSAVFAAEHRATDPHLRVSIAAATEPADRVFTATSATSVIRLMLALPHGVVRMSSDVPGLVETSTNFATVRTDIDSSDQAAATVKIKTSQRSSVQSQLRAVGERIRSVAELAGATCSVPTSYPPWEPKTNSALLDRCTRVYTAFADTEPVVDVIHAGLECGIIGAKYPRMEMVSLGPTIKHPHSPDERLNLASLERVTEFTRELLADLAGA